MPLSFHEYYRLFYDEYFPSKGEKVLERYLEAGGYLAILNGKLRTKDIISTLKTDINAVGKNTSVARNILGAIMDVAPDPVSFRKLAERAGVLPSTVQNYIELFEGLYILLQVLFIDEGKRILEKKDRELIIRNPLLVKAIAQWTERTLRESVLYEWVV